MIFVLGILIKAPTWFYFVAAFWVIIKFIAEFIFLEGRYINTDNLVKIIDKSVKDLTSRRKEKGHYVEFYTDEEGILRAKECTDEKQQ